MTESGPARKWDALSGFYDLLTRAEHLRLAPAKRSLFSKARGRVLMVGAGTGTDFAFLPQGLEVIAMDVSPGMVEKMRARSERYEGRAEVRVMDARKLDFSSEYFDTALAACVFCSVPQPALGLAEVRRVLRPGGRLLLVEHVRSRIGAVSLMQDLFTTVSRRVGPDMNRDTVGTILRVGFRLVREENLYLDIVKAIEAEK